MIPNSNCSKQSKNIQKGSINSRKLMRKCIIEVLSELPWEWEYPWGFPYPWDGNGDGKDFFPVGIPIGIPMGNSNTVSLGHP